MTDASLATDQRIFRAQKARKQWLWELYDHLIEAAEDADKKSETQLRAAAEYVALALKTEAASCSKTLDAVDNAAA